MKKLEDVINKLFDDYGTPSQKAYTKDLAAAIRQWAKECVPEKIIGSSDRSFIFGLGFDYCCQKTLERIEE